MIGAFTATATERVKEDIVRLLALRSPLQVTTGFDRPNLFFDVAQPRRKDEYLKTFLYARRNQSGIIYCSTRKTVEKLCEKLRREGFSAARYHAGLSDAERNKNQDDFVYDRALIMVATNAFGMGIDKSNISYVVHYNMPKDIESYYQEAGRAGRDGSPAVCVLLFSASDVMTARFLIDHGQDNEALSEEERDAVRRRDLERLNRMVDYCKTGGCYRQVLLAYFGENAPASCGNCGNCLSPVEEKDITVVAQKILSGVARVERKYPYGLGLTLVVRMLHGSKEQCVLELGLDELSTYGILHGVKRSVIREYVEHLRKKGYLVIQGPEFPVVRLTDKANAVLFGGERVTVPQRVWQEAGNQPEPERRQHKGAQLPRDTSGADELYDVLRDLRMKQAHKEGVPAYVVFSNATLRNMAQRQPVNIEEFLRVSGVGSVKAQKYGRLFTEAIRQWKEKS